MPHRPERPQGRTPTHPSVAPSPALLGLLCAVLAACASNTSATGPAGKTGGADTTGSLAVTITAPQGVTASVTITGPAGYSRTISTSTTLAALAPGSYTISAGTGVGADSIVGTPYTGSVAGSPAAVAAQATATASVTYTQRAEQGLLWAAGLGSFDVAGFTSGQLAGTGSPAPHVAVNLDGPLTLAADAQGGLWTSPGIGDTLLYYTQAQLLAGGTPTPAVRISPASGLDGVTAMALDARGNLWVAGQYSNTIAEFTVDQLSSGGAKAPATVVTGALGTLARPFAIAFDAKGNLWAANVTDSALVAFSPSQLSAGGLQVPFAGITNTDISVPYALAFDAAGDLWVASANGPVYEFSSSDLQGIGSPKPTVTITLQHAGIAAGLAFDQSGDLWVADFQNSLIAEYAPSALSTTGTPAPAVVIGSNGGSLGDAYALAFSPHATNLPLH